MNNTEKAKMLAEQLKRHNCTDDFYSGFYQGALVALNAITFSKKMKPENNEMHGEYFANIDTVIKECDIYTKLQIINEYLKDLEFYMTEEQRSLCKEIDYAKVSKIQAIRDNNFELAAKYRSDEISLLKILKELK